MARGVPRGGAAVPVVSLPLLGEVCASERGVMPPRAPETARGGGRMVDSHGRTIRDLRISITDRCNFRCVYCMEPDVQFAAAANLLSVEEIVRVARVAETLGVRKIRLTGGEPTLHPALGEIIARIRRATRVEIALITNASVLTREKLRAWKAAGLRRVTVSIDSLRADRFARMTRPGAGVTPETVLAGVEMCLAEGLKPLKLNVVLIRGFNEDEAADLAALARRWAVEVRFIEYMPLDSAHAWDAGKWVSAAETRAAIEGRFALVACGDDDPASTSRTFVFADGTPGRVGFIAPVSTPFCGACSRLRLTADGMVRPCLFSTAEWDLRGVMRGGASDAEVAGFLIDATWTKQAGHGIAGPGFEQPARPMSAIGG